MPPTPERKPPATAASRTRRPASEIAKVTLSRRSEPVLSDPDKLKLTLTIYLPRKTAEQLVTRAVAEARNLEDIIGEVLERSA